jgi:hypothetical protein
MSTFDEAVKEIKKTKDILDGEVTSIKHPDAKKHLYVSLAKSAIRILAGGCLVTGNFVFAGIGFILAEVLGIVEELV